ncbi:MAG TPA: HEPN domain-containing protein, partial [Stellaceae bacterium]|nr:HEPN domain-containing protein [Stellaceae bacterium]
MTKRAQSLIVIAEKDLSHATDVLRTHPQHAAFSAQQAAEKLMKAVLEREGVSYPSTTHQLFELVSLIPKTNPFRADLMPLGPLTTAATKYRYPTPRGEAPEDPDPDEIENDLARIRRLLPEIKAWLR